MIHKVKALTPKQLYQKGEVLREKDKHLEALQVLDEAIVRSVEARNYRNLIDTLKARVLTWKHLFLLSKDLVYRTLARKDAESMLEIANEFHLKDKLHTSYFRLGEVDMLFEDYPKAIKNYKKALKTYVGPISEKGDYRYHLGEAAYRSGDKKTGKETILEGLKEIDKGADQIDSFVIHVWESGAYMRLADLLRKDEPEEARKYFAEALKIIESDPKLIIRRRQIEELSKSLGV
jgi:tetratricopeptide (TPR) repeat protein